MKNVFFTLLNLMLSSAICLGMREFTCHQSVGLMKGLLFYFILYMVWLRKKSNYGFIAVLSHEVNHALVGMLINLRITDLSVRSDGSGEIRHRGLRGYNIWLHLCPYCLPLLTLLILSFRGMISTNYMSLYLTVVGISYGFYIVTFLEQTRSYQTDLQKVGIGLSYIFIFCTNVLFFLTIFSVTEYGWMTFIDQICYGFTVMLDESKKLFTKIKL